MAVSRIASTCLLAALAAPAITPAAENSLAGARELLLGGKYAEAADVDDLAVRRKLAQLALDRGAHAEAADWANQAIHIDVMDAEVHRLFAEALAGSHNYREAIEEFEIAVELEPTQLPQRLALAEACIRARKPAKARRVVEALLELAPDYPGAQALIETHEETDPL